MIKKDTTLQSFRGENNKLPLYDLSFVEDHKKVFYLRETENVDLTDAGHLRRRLGSLLKYVCSGGHSIWGNKEICLFREGQYLKRFNTITFTVSTLRSGLSTAKLPMSYLEIDSKIYYADGLINGIVDNGVSRTWGISTPTDGFDMNTEYAIPPVGTLLEYYNGMIFIAIGNEISHTEPFAYELYRPSSHRITLTSAITMIEAVRDGLWIGTEKETIFLQGNTPPFKQAVQIESKVIKFSSRKIPGNLIDNKLTDTVALWTSPDGVYVGGNNGFYLNLTKDSHSFPDALIGSSLFKEERGINQYIVSLKEPTVLAKNAYNPEIIGVIDAILPNLTINAS